MNGSVRMYFISTLIFARQNTSDQWTSFKLRFLSRRNEAIFEKPRGIS